MKLKSLVNKCRNSFIEIEVHEQKKYKLIFNGKEEELTDCILERKVKEWQTNSRCLFIVLKKKIKAEVKEEVKPKVDNDTLYYFLRNHKDLDEKRVIVRYTNIEGRLVYIRLSNLNWNWERMSLILNYKVEHQETRDDGDLILYLEDCREK